jgi:hypothetical protein
MRPCLLLASVLLVTPALAGCGGSNKSSEQQAATSWANGLCQSFITWQSNVKSAAKKATAGQISKSSLQTAAAGISDANTKLADDLDGLGRPPGQGSKEAKAAISQLADDLRKNAAKVRDAAAGVSSRQEVMSAVSTISGTLAAMGDDLSVAAGKLRGLGHQDTWKKAFADSEACQKLTNGG